MCNTQSLRGFGHHLSQKGRARFKSPIDAAKSGDWKNAHVGSGYFSSAKNSVNYWSGAQRMEESNDIAWQNYRERWGGNDKGDEPASQSSSVDDISVRNRRTILGSTPTASQTLLGRRSNV